MLGEPLQNNFDALLDEINAVSSQREQMQIAKAFEDGQMMADAARPHKTPKSLLKALQGMDALSKKYAKQANKIESENRHLKQEMVIKGFRVKLKESLLQKSITPQQAMMLENKFNNLTANLGAAL